MPMYNLIEYSDNYSKTSGSLWKYYRDIPAVNYNDKTVDFGGSNLTDSFKTTILKSSLCDYNDVLILAKGTITVNNTSAADADANSANKIVISKNCAPITDCKREISNVEIDNAKDIGIVMPMYNLIDYSDNYSKTSGSLWQKYRDIPAVNYNDEIVDFGEGNLTDSFNFKVKITGQTGDDGRKGVEIMVPLKHLSNFWRTLEMPLINCELNLILTWSANCVMVSAYNAT